MKQSPRIYYSESQKALMWDRWQQGESLQHIAQLFDRNHSSILGILAQTGGIRPAPRKTRPPGTHPHRKRRDFTRFGGGKPHSMHCVPSGSRSLDDQS
ncbi:hypothetical protein GCM10010971_26460 [Silvimonas amylolytica]|uniref:Helix-turn-helix domain-containing protein n=1 Tax=Silvimonas amylolytica TaxID=449663 RepID=A0ABQ2PP86_9NEIS|nr:hypothetical protein [Silvimonas amylolytica]GGP26827.1 hypothetical protein GCM10010971_26460 [Silvimonas amylolytica]